MIAIQARLPVASFLVVSALLAACGGQPPSTQTRFELPQQMRLEQNALATALERRSGRIAVIDATGNLLVMDQTGGDIKRITVDANGRAPGQTGDNAAPGQRPGPNAVRYQIPVWSPDAARLVLAQITLLPSNAQAYIGEGLDSVTIRPGADSQVASVDARGRQSAVEAPAAGLTVTRPGAVYVLPPAAESESRVAASALYIASSDGKTPLREIASATGAAYPYYDWSPDGAQLAVLSQSPGATVPSTLALVSADGMTGKVIYNGLDAFWDWNHDGGALFNHGLGSRTQGDEVLGVINARSGGVTPAGGKEDYPFLAPHFSPDGKTAVIATRVGNKPWLSLVDANGRNIKELVALDGLALFAWSPQGGRLAYTTRVLGSGNRPQYGPLRVLDVGTGEERVLLQRPTAAFFWSPDGTRLAVFSQADANAATSFAGVVAVTASSTSPYALHSIDSLTGAARALLLFEATPQFDVVLRRFDRYSRGLTIWSPDSMRMVVPILLNQGSQGSTGFVLEMEATGSVSPRVISVGGVMAVWSPR